MNGNDRSHSSVVSTPSTWISTAALLASIAFGFYTVANPKQDVVMIRNEVREDIRATKEDFEKNIRLLKEDFVKSLQRVEDALKDDIKVIKLSSLSLPEHREFVARTDRALDYAGSEITRIRGDQVTRAEQQQHWNEFTDRINAVRDYAAEIRKSTDLTVSELRRDTGGQVTLRDQLQSMEGRITFLTQRLDATRRMTVPIPDYPPMPQPQSQKQQ